MTDDRSIRLPVGVRDFLPRAAARRRAIIERLLGAFEAWGYARIIAPAFEYADVLERGLGRDAKAAAIRFVEPLTGEIVVLRPDITSQVARMAATRLRDIGGPIRLCYEGAVTRLTPGARGQREVLQAGVELIGVSSPQGDAEVLAVAGAALASMQVDDVRLDLGHAEIARVALGKVTDPDRRADLETALGKKDRAGVVAAAAGVPKPQRALLEELPRLYGSPRVVLSRARKLRLPAPAERALDTIEQVLALAKDLMDADQHRRITIDLGEVRGFEYYTGIRLAGYGVGVGEAVLRGGRYDRLLGAYGYDACATGFAVDVEAIAHSERSAGIAAPSEAAAVVIAAVPAHRALAVKVAAALRGLGLRVAVDAGVQRSVKALAGYAERVGYARVLVVDDRGGRVIDACPEPGRNDGETAVSLASLRRAARGDAEPLLGALGLGEES